MNITQEQATWVAQNILWLIPLALFLFTSIVIGFWKLVGKLFGKSEDTLQEKKGEAISPSYTPKQEGKTVINNLPPVPVGEY